MEHNVRKPLSNYVCDNIADYPNETTIHGIKYLAKADRSVVEHVFWITTIILSVTCLGYFIVNIIIRWFEFPIMVVEEKLPTHIFHVPFPAVTICPSIKSTSEILWHSSMDKAEFWEGEVGKRIIMKTQICRPSFTTIYERFMKKFSMLSKTLETNWKDTLTEMAPKLETIFKSCQVSLWHNLLMKYHQQNCQKLFAPIITNDGLCFTFNTVSEVLRNESLHQEFTYYDIKNGSDGWDPELGYSKHIAYPYKATSNGLLILMEANATDRSALCNPSTLGYKLILHSPTVYPHTYENFIALDYGMEYKIAVKPKTITTPRHLKSLRPETRQCFYQNERPLKYYTYYTEVNCKLECYTNYTIQMFGGAPFSSPRTANTTNYRLPSFNYGWEFPNNFGLIYEYNKVYGVNVSQKKELTINTNCNCLPECNALNYEYKFITTNSELHQSLKSTGNYTSNILRTSLKIVFDEPSFVGQKRVEMYTFATLLSDFGGLLGLFLGGSILSLFELFYYLTIRNHSRRN